MCQKRLSRGTKYYGELGYGGPAMWSPGRDAGNAQRSTAGRGGGLK